MAAHSLRRSRVFGRALDEAASADVPPERGSLSMKYLNYQDSQSGVIVAASAGSFRERMRVNALALMVVMPVACKWLLGALCIDDSVTGASLAYHSSD